MIARLVPEGWEVWVGPGESIQVSMVWLGHEERPERPEIDKDDKRYTGQMFQARALANPWAKRTGPVEALRRFVHLLSVDDVLCERIHKRLAGKRVGASCPAHGSLLVDVANGVPMHQAEARALEQLGETLDLFA